MAGLLLVVPSAVAHGEVPWSPNLEGRYDESTSQIHLQWDAPNSEVGHEYQVYHNGALIATTSQTNYTITIDPGSIVAKAVHVFQVAVNDAVLSAPVSLVLFGDRPQVGPLDDYVPPKCELVIVFIYPDEIPPVDWVIDDACKEGWGRYIEYLIEELTGIALQTLLLHQSSEG